MLILTLLKFEQAFTANMLSNLLNVWPNDFVMGYNRSAAHSSISHTLNKELDKSHF